MILQQMLHDEGFSESDLDFRVQLNLKMKPDEQVPDYSTVVFTQEGREYGGLFDTLFTMDTTIFEDDELNDSELENVGASFLSDPDMKRALQLQISDDSDSVFGESTAAGGSQSRFSNPVESDGGRESELAPNTPPSQSSDLDDFERFKRELEMSMPIPSPGLSDTDRLNLEIDSSNSARTKRGTGSDSDRKKLTGVEKKLQKKSLGGKPPTGNNLRRSKSAKLSSEDALGPRERYRGCVSGALTPGARRRNPPPSAQAPTEFDNKDFAARCKFKDTKEFKMMEMLRKAELGIQKRKRQLMNRQIAELQQELANFANDSIDTMTVEEYDALREKLRLLPKDVRENNKGKALIAKIEQEAYLSRARMRQNTYQAESEEQKKAFRKAQLTAIRNKRKKESAMLKQVMATGDVAPQQTLKRTREAVSRWLITNENGAAGEIDTSALRSSQSSQDDSASNTVEPDVMEQYSVFRDKVKAVNEEILASGDESAVLIAVQGIMFNTFIEFREWLYGNAKFPCDMSNIPGLLLYFESAEVLAHYNEFKANKKELRRQKARHRRMPGSGVGRSQSLRRSRKTDSVVDSLKKSGSAQNIADGLNGLKRSESGASMTSSASCLSRSSSFHRLARGSGSQISLLVAGQDSQGMSVPASAAGQYDNEDNSTSGDEVWLQMVAAKLEKVKQAKKEKLTRLGDIIDKVVRAIVSRCTCKTPFQLDRVGDGKYKLPHTSQIFFVRILRNHVMVRVGGGWDTLDHFIAKHDPCRMKFKQIVGGAKYSPAGSATNSPAPGSRKSLTGSEAASSRRSVPNSPSSNSLHKSASGNSLRSPSPRTSNVKDSPLATPKSSTTPKTPTSSSRMKKGTPKQQGTPRSTTSTTTPRSDSKLPRPGGRGANSRLPTPKSRAV